MVKVSFIYLKPHYEGGNQERVFYTSKDFETVKNEILSFIDKLVKDNNVKYKIETEKPEYLRFSFYREHVNVTGTTIKDETNCEIRIASIDVDVNKKKEDALQFFLKKLGD